MTLSEYLVQRYLNASSISDPSNPRKRKRKDPSKSKQGITITDDDALVRTGAEDGEDEDEPAAVMSNGVPEFRRTKQSGWTLLAPAAADSAASTANDADNILRAAAQEDEEKQRQAEESEQPTMVPETDLGPEAGLQTAEQMSRQLAAKRRKEMTAFEGSGKTSAGRGQKTVYRDASGRIIDVALRRAEARKQAEDEERKAQEEEKALLEGRAQVAKRDERRQELEDVQFEGIARGKDDVKMNAELRAKSRWGDPMAGLIQEDELDRPGGEMGALTPGNGGSRSKGKTYRGGYQPNRYGIPPGHRWDGVDRGNGFENKWFASRNRREKNEARDYAWQMDE